MRDKFINAISKREINLIIGTGLLILIVIALSSCQNNKKEIQPISSSQIQNGCFTINLIKDVNWKPIFNGYYAPKCNSDSSYYENGAYVGKWYSDGCANITVFNPNVTVNNFTFGIYRLTSDTLIVVTGRFGVTKFYK